MKGEKPHLSAIGVSTTELVRYGAIGYHNDRIKIIRV